MSASKKEKATPSKVFTIEEVSKHNDPAGSFWIVINGDVLDLTKFINEHPGGVDVLLKYAGGKKDAGTVFENVHSTDAREKAKDFIIGKLASAQDKEEDWIKCQSKESTLEGTINLMIKKSNASFNFRSHQTKIVINKN